ncbi:MAG TPA: hypothetical protein VH413_10055 [Verrucomicrobiae bacterium]|jgi:hypothetical protein|nr:hypothetical protein [Verrucomicrobiae bacterium]
MTAPENIASLLEEWRALSQDEAVAIRSAKWTSVREIQARKTELQKTLAAADANWSAQNPAAAAKPFRKEVGHLISLEARNAELLAAQMRRARLEQQTFEQAGRNLRKIQRSYTRRAAFAAWQCYS